MRPELTARPCRCRVLCVGESVCVLYHVMDCCFLLDPMLSPRHPSTPAEGLFAFLFFHSSYYIHVLEQWNVFARRFTFTVFKLQLKMSDGTVPKSTEIISHIHLGKSPYRMFVHPIPQSLPLLLGLLLWFLRAACSSCFLLLFVFFTTQRMLIGSLILRLTD